MTCNIKSFHILNNQDYTKIRDNCLKGPKILWEDTSYEAAYGECSDWDWKRPGEIVDNPRFVNTNNVESPLRFSLNNLDLGESPQKDVTKYNLATLSALTLNPRVFRFVVPEDNIEFLDENYLGLFHIRLWRYGKFYDVVVDDRLPTREGKLVSFLKDGCPEVFWPFILEKAYTKLCGSMKTLGKITIPDLFVDLCGGISESHIALGHTKPLLAELDTILRKALDKESFIIFGRHWHTNVENMSMGNIYCVTKAVYVNNSKSEQILILRISMPFITEISEWNSEEPDEWQSILEANKSLIGAVQEHEFWMPFSEFNKHDWNIYIVYWNPPYIENMGSENLIWCSASADGKWVKGVSSGGNRRDYSGTTFYLNPQYSISLKLPDTGLSDCTVIISLLQKTHKSDRVPMDFYIFELKQKTEERLDWDFFKHNNPVIDSFPHNEEREVSKCLKIPAGNYCIVVASNEPHHEAQFILRVFAEQKFTMSLLTESVAQKDMDVRVSRISYFNNQEAVQESDKKVYAFFEEVSGEDKVVGWVGLKRVLDFAMDNEKSKSENYLVRNSLISYIFPTNSVFDTMESKEFSKDITRTLLATEDFDHSGKLTLQEFQGLWTQVRHWIQIYEMNSDDSGYLPKENLREALDSAGFQLTSDILCNLAIRYSNRDSVIPFDDFLMCTSKLRTIFDYYRYKDPECKNRASFTLEEWLQKSIYS